MAKKIRVTSKRKKKVSSEEVAKALEAKEMTAKEVNDLKKRSLKSN